MTGTLQVRLLGHASFARDGEPVKFAKRATTIAMLALLILRRGQPFAGTALAFTLFPDDDEEQALAELRRYLHLASKALPTQRFRAGRLERARIPRCRPKRDR